jgi:DNA-binding MarR family transcriptional regulator
MSAATAVKTTSPPAGQEGTLSDGELRAWRGLLRAHACLAKRLDAELEREHRLPLSSYEVLNHLDDAGAGRMRMSDLADQAQLSRSGLTRLVDRLERDGLLERCSCEHDARGAYACLTDLGRERLAQARTTQLAVVREHFFSRFSEPELGALADMWERIAPCGNGNGHAVNGCGAAANGHDRVANGHVVAAAASEHIAANGHSC